MKKLFLSVVVALFMTSAFAATDTPNTKSNYVETYKELSKLLNAYTQLDGIGEDTVVKVRIVINENHEIVVMSTSTDDDFLNTYIKTTLNYQKIEANELASGNGLVFLVKFMK